MPIRSKITRLPEDVRRELNQRLIENSFSGYEALSEWLATKNYQISPSTIHRHGKRFEQQLAAIKTATEQAKAILETVGDDENALADALTRLAQQKAFQALIDFDIENDEDLSFTKLGQMIANLNRSSITIRKYQSEIREKLNIKFQILETETNKRNLDAETLKAVREEIYGIF